MSFQNLSAGASGEFTVCVKSVSSLTCRDGSPYQKIVIRDQEGHEGTAFRFEPLFDLTAPVVVFARLENKNNCLRLVSFTKTMVPVSDFLPKSRVDPASGWKTLMDTIQAIRPGLGRLVCAMFSGRKKRLLSAPMSETGAYSRQGGVLEATLRLLKLAENASGLLETDTDLLLAGAMVYYLGYLDTMDDTFLPTKDDVLYGPGAAAYTSLLSAAAALRDEKDVEQKDVELLGHILLSRSGGICPAIPEAAVLRRLDALLRDVDEMKEMTANAQPGTIARKNKKRVYAV